MKIGYRRQRPPSGDPLNRAFAEELKAALTSPPAEVETIWRMLPAIEAALDGGLDFGQVMEVAEKIGRQQDPPLDLSNRRRFGLLLKRARAYRDSGDWSGKSVARPEPKGGRRAEASDSGAERAKEGPNSSSDTPVEPTPIVQTPPKAQRRHDLLDRVDPSPLPLDENQQISPTTTQKAAAKKAMVRVHVDRAEFQSATTHQKEILRNLGFVEPDNPSKSLFKQFDAETAAQRCREEVVKLGFSKASVWRPPK